MLWQQVLAQAHALHHDFFEQHVKTPKFRIPVKGRKLVETAFEVLCAPQAGFGEGPHVTVFASLGVTRRARDADPCIGMK